MRNGQIMGLAAAREYINFFRDPITCMRRLYRQFGPLVSVGSIAFGRPRKPHVLAVGPEFNRQVLGDPATFRSTGQFIRGPANSAQRRLRFGLTRSTGAEHKRQRQLVMPPFHKKAVESYHAFIVEMVNAVIGEWQIGRRYDMHGEMRKLTLRVSSTILFSDDPAEASIIGKLFEEWQYRNFLTSVWILPLDLPGTAFRRLLKHAQRLENELLAIIKRRRATPNGRGDVLSLLIEARDDENKGMTDAELVGQATILIGASFETTASTLTWILFLLAQHPNVMRRLMEELDAVLAGAPPTLEQLRQLSFLECVIKESMRILPPVPFTIRATTREVAIGSQLVPNGSRVICSHYLTHHLPEIYPEPERFQPERWRDIDPTQFEYMPFSAGPRACIGAMFAFQVLKISLALIFQKFRLGVIPGSRIDCDVRITMAPRFGMPMMVFDNDRKFAAAEVQGQIREMVTLP
jgi:cytochrome P450